MRYLYPHWSTNFLAAVFYSDNLDSDWVMNYNLCFHWFADFLVSDLVAAVMAVYNPDSDWLQNVECYHDFDWSDGNVFLNCHSYWPTEEECFPNSGC